MRRNVMIALLAATVVVSKDPSPVRRRKPALRGRRGLVGDE
jgi:hypothetical protein